MKESKTLEFKENVSNTFLKTVSAFANYNGGEILFGVDDNGNETGIKDLKQTCLDIENKINDSIVPQPAYSISIIDQVISLKIEPGNHKPYMYKSKAYRRNDTSTIEVDPLELSRLILEGQNIKFESLACKKQNLDFTILRKQIMEKVHLENFTNDTMRTLNLYNNEIGYNNVAGILADENDFPGIDIAKFGESVNIIQRRATYSNMSILRSYEMAVEEFRTFYEYEEIKGIQRLRIEKIPEDAFREAVANAIVHRAWDISAQIRVLMFDDHIEISSPGGLSSDISEEEYLAGIVSVPGNPILANVFFRLGYIEVLGTGIRRIRRLYEGSVTQPEFKVYDNSITVILPLFEEEMYLNDDELEIYQALKNRGRVSMSAIVSEVSFGRSKVIKIVQHMIEKGIIEVSGNGRGTKYQLK